MSSADEADFTQDVKLEANGEFDSDVRTESSAEPDAPGNGSAALADDGEHAPAYDIPKGTDDNVAEDRKLFVGGLSWETREAQLKEYFEKFGEIESVNLKLDPMTGKSRCFAFIVYKDPADLSKVFAAGEHAINSKKVDVKKARAKPGKIFVGGLKPEMTDEQIREYFEQFGTIIEFDMPFDKIKKQRKGFGFITFEREETMKELIKRSKVTIGEHEVDLRKATPKPDYNNAYRGGYGAPASYGAGPMTSAAPGDYYGGYGGDYYGGGYGGYADYYNSMGAAGWGAGGGYAGYGMSAGGGKMRGSGAVGRGGGAAGPKRGGAPY